jgi:hypothetical protein
MPLFRLAVADGTSKNPKNDRRIKGFEDLNPVSVTVMLPPARETIEYEANETIMDDSVPATELLKLTTTSISDDSNAEISVSIVESKIEPVTSLVAE